MVAMETYVQSDDFLSLPLEMQHQVLVEIREQRREDALTGMSILPKVGALLQASLYAGPRATPSSFTFLLIMCHDME